MSRELIIDGYNFTGCNLAEFPNKDNNTGGARGYLVKLQQVGLSCLFHPEKGLG